MANEEEIPGYQRRTSTGQVVNVKPHQRGNQEAADSVLTLPGRPPIAAKPGTFANGRSIPNVWIEPVEELEMESPDDEVSPEALGVADKLLASLDGVPGSEAAVRALRALQHKTLPKPSVSDKTAKVIAAAQKISAQTIELASPVKISSYKRRSNKTGKLVDVRSYVQLRDLVSALGGPQLAAQKGITTQIFAAAMPEAPKRSFDQPDRPALPRPKRSFDRLHEGDAPEHKQQVKPLRDGEKSPDAPEKTTDAAMQRLIDFLANRPVGKTSRGPNRLLTKQEDGWTIDYSKDQPDEVGTTVTDEKALELLGRDKIEKLAAHEDSEKSLTNAPPEDRPTPDAGLTGEEARGKVKDALNEAAEATWGSHRPDEEGPQINNLANGTVFPDDVYDRPDLYSFGEGGIQKESVDTVQSLRGKPDNTPITVYRAVPKGVSEFREGDWVSISKAYAQQHAIGAMPDGGDFDVIETQVPAKTVRNGGNDLIEWGYWGPTKDTKKITPMIAPPGDLLSNEEQRRWNFQKMHRRTIMNRGGMEGEEKTYNGVTVGKAAVTGGGFDVWATDEEGEVIGYGYFQDQGERLNPTTVQTRSDMNPKPIESAMRRYLTETTGRPLTDTRPPPPAVREGSKTPPKLGDEYLVTASGLLSFKGQDYRLSPGDKVFQVHGYGDDQGYLVENAEGERVALIKDSFNGSSTVVGEDVNSALGYLILDAQRAFDYDNRQEPEDIGEELWPDGILKPDAFLTPVWTHKKKASIADLLSQLQPELEDPPEGMTLQVGHESFRATSSGWRRSDGTPINSLQLSARLAKGFFPGLSPAEVLFNARQAPSGNPPKTYTHAAIRDPDEHGLSGFPAAVGGTKDIKSKARNAIRDAAKFVPESVAKRFPVTYVGGHSQTNKSLAQMSPGTLAFVRSDDNDGRNQTLHLPDTLDGDDFPGVVLASQSTGWMVPSAATPYQAIVNHETGHIWENMMLSQGSAELQDRFYSRLATAIANEFGLSPDFSNDARLRFAVMFDKARTSFSSGLSSYSATNEREVIAEAWAEYIGAETPRRIALIFGSTIQEMLDELAEEFDRSVAQDLKED